MPTLFPTNARTSDSHVCSCSVDFPEDQITTLESHEHVKAVEKDQEMKTQ
jgi:hypothetical protein